MLLYNVNHSLTTVLRSSELGLFSFAFGIGNTLRAPQGRQLLHAPQVTGVTGAPGHLIHRRTSGWRSASVTDTVD